MSYKDEVWYRKLTQAIDERREAFSDKQWTKFQVPLLLKLARRIKDNSDGCQVCREYQHTLTRLEEEFQELPGSRAQQQYQARTLLEISEHYVKGHRLVPEKYYARKWLMYGLIGGAVLGFIAMFVASNLLYFPAGIALGAVFGAMYGNTEDSRVQHDHRVL